MELDAGAVARCLEDDATAAVAKRIVDEVAERLLGRRRSARRSRRDPSSSRSRGRIARRARKRSLVPPGGRSPEAARPGPAARRSRSSRAEQVLGEPSEPLRLLDADRLPAPASASDLGGDQARARFAASREGFAVRGSRRRRTSARARVPSRAGRAAIEGFPSFRISSCAGGSVSRLPGAGSEAGHGLPPSERSLSEPPSSARLRRRERARAHCRAHG